MSDTARAMSQENGEVVRRMYELWSSGDWKGWWSWSIRMSSSTGPSAASKRATSAVAQTSQAALRG